MSSFIKTASKTVYDPKAFLRESAGGNGIKYSAEKGARHVVYVPFVTQQVEDEATNQTITQKVLCAISGDVHEWTTADGKFKSTVCLKDVIRNADNGSVLNDGSCPFCDRVSDGWDIYNYRKELEELNCKLTGDARKQHLEKTFQSFREERKAKEVRKYLYILVVKFKTNDAGGEVLGADGLPEYELKVMKLSASRVEKIQQQITNSGSELVGSELIFEYPNVDDRRLLVGQSTTTPVFPNNRITAKYPALLNKINEDVSKFEWDGIEKAFPEWSGMSTAEANTITHSLFEQWDGYKAERLTNPNAKYLEYVVRTPNTNPNLNGADGTVPPLPTVPTIAGAASGGAVGNIPMPNVAVPNVPIPNVAVPNVPVPGATATPTAAPDPNSVFNGTGAGAPSINI